MNRVPFIFVFFFSLLAVQADIPWENIKVGNAYWANVLGVDGEAPKAITTERASSVVNLKPDPSIQLLNAVLRHQINELENKALVRFADSMMHVMMYVSGASPAMPDGQNRAGWWKLPYPVAMRYGLIINSDIDERFDFEKSTQVAMQYVQSLARDQGKLWLLAFVNAPTECHRQNAVKINEDLQCDLATLYNVMVASNFTPSEEYAISQFYNTVQEYNVDHVLLKDLIYEQTGIQAQAFEALNPTFSGSVIPKNAKVCLTALALDNLKKNKEDIVLLSDLRIEEASENLALARARIVKNQPDPRTATTNYYKVKSGDNLGVLASRFGVKVSDIKSWNSLRGNTIYIGQKLLVYSSKARKPKPVTHSSKPKKTESVKPAVRAGGEFITYKVKTGDTLYSIAKRFPGVSANNLMAWNGISAKIKVGQNIKVLKSEIRDYSTDKYPDRI